MEMFAASNPDRQPAEAAQRAWATLGNIGSLATAEEEKS